MCHLQTVSSLGIEERRALTFWNKSKEVRRVIWRSEAYFLVFVVLLVGVIFVLTHLLDWQMMARFANMPIEPVSRQAKLFGLFMQSIAYFIFSFLFIGCNLARFLKKNIDRIVAMDIEPWPVDKPYTPAHPALPFMNLPQRSEDSTTYIDEILRMDPKTPFTWSGFIRLLMIPVIFILGWVAVQYFVPFVKGLF